VALFQLSIAAPTRKFPVPANCCSFLLLLLLLLLLLWPCSCGAAADSLRKALGSCDGLKVACVLQCAQMQA
jgi:hypothetical protein